VDKANSASAPVLRAVTVKVGIADNYNTEVLEGLKEGDSVVTGINLPPNTAAARTAGSSPFGGPFGGGPRPR
jgi:multidrug efflux pump subunit AcrA (membrane-fusion protein)